MAGQLPAVHSASVDILALLAAQTATPTRQPVSPQVVGIEHLSHSQPNRDNVPDGTAALPRAHADGEQTQVAGKLETLPPQARMPARNGTKARENASSSLSKPAWGAGSGATQTADIVGGGGRTNRLGAHFPQSVPRSSSGRLMWNSVARPSPYAQNHAKTDDIPFIPEAPSASSAQPATTEQHQRPLRSAASIHGEDLARCVFQRARTDTAKLHAVLAVLEQASAASAACGALDRGVPTEEVASVLFSAASAASLQSHAKDRRAPSNSNATKSMQHFVPIFVAVLLRGADAAQDAAASGRAISPTVGPTSSAGRGLQGGPAAHAHPSVPQEHTHSKWRGGSQPDGDASSPRSTASPDSDRDSAASSAGGGEPATLPQAHELPFLPMLVARRSPARSASWAVSLSRPSRENPPPPRGQLRSQAEGGVPRAKSETCNGAAVEAPCADSSPPLSALQAALAFTEGRVPQLVPPPDTPGSDQHMPSSATASASAASVEQTAAGSVAANNTSQAHSPPHAAEYDSDDSVAAAGPMPQQPEGPPPVLDPEDPHIPPSAVEVAPASTGCCGWWGASKSAKGGSEASTGEATWQGTA